MWFRRRGHSLPTYPLQAVLVVYTRGEPIWVHRLYSDGNGHDPIAGQNQTLAMQSPAVLGYREGLRRISQDHTQRYLRMVR